MKPLLLCFLATSIASAELTDQQKKVQAIAETNQVELHLDQPYAENDNLKTTSGPLPAAQEELRETAPGRRTHSWWRLGEW
jgi:hypothetical protein